MRDAIIVGAGPAGSLAAIHLARAGWNVLIIEQQSFPRDKVCGECLSALGLSVLSRARLIPSLHTLHPRVLKYTQLFGPHGESARIKLHHSMWGLSRLALDEALIHAAHAAGANIHQPARCEAIESADRPTVIVRHLRTNERVTMHADLVLLADGKGALLTERPIATNDFGIKAHFTGVEASDDTIELFSVEGHYGGIAPIEGDRWNAAFSVPSEKLQKSHGDIDALFDSILCQNTELERQFKNARRIASWLTSPLPRFRVADQWPRGVIPLGNAAAALEPIGGEGMGLALRSAEIVVEALLQNDPIPLESMRTALKRLWQIRRPACRLAARVLSSPRLAAPTIELLSANPALSAFALGIIGKAAR
jgi:flavin-dependent dehydrogenase